MFATRRLLQSCRITFFTRETCGLCKQAKGVLSDVWDKRPFAYTEVNVDAPQPEPKAWRALYDFDVPVIHISKATAPGEDPAKSGKAIKLMHRFTVEQVEAQMDKAEGK
ncbi:hypothetical protein B0J13DRAFT_74243 [Dactylonectria estremocensis]|uniref:Glutaredoxin-like protein n=1 Tax=Dactylonectria estremocensis TaxID=1079267 RepID=A0A9P9EHH8_9HYPO|nr:hypothetical protein B0J13DRAFT_74243 [Dactylonectria estremocensis]